MQKMHTQHNTNAKNHTCETNKECKILNIWEWFSEKNNN